MNEFQISVDETKKKLAIKKILLIDVREQFEYELANIKGSILIPMDELPGKLKEIRKLAGNKEVIVHCHHGIRSAFAAEFLRRNGINARSMDGGIDEWSNKIDKKVSLY